MAFAKISLEFSSYDSMLSTINPYNVWPISLLYTNILFPYSPHTYNQFIIFRLTKSFWYMTPWFIMVLIVFSIFFPESHSINLSQYIPKLIKHQKQLQPLSPPPQPPPAHQQPLPLNQKLRTHWQPRFWPKPKPNYMRHYSPMRPQITIKTNRHTLKIKWSIIIRCRPTAGPRVDKMLS